MINYSKKELKILNSWGMHKNPFVAIKDYSHIKSDLRWENKENLLAYDKYWMRREKWTNNINFEKYYKTASKPIDKKTWEYLRLRKSYFIMPLGWEKIARDGINILDIGCGDGDITQNLVDFISNNTKRKIQINIYGIDINASRINNCKRLVKSTSKNIKLKFLVHDLTKKNYSKFKKNFFDYCICSGVLEILSEPKLKIFLKNLSNIVKKGIYIEDVAETFPGGWPRHNLGYYLLKYGFKIKKRHLVFTEPFKKNKLSDPKKIWPITLDQNIWAEK
jgi:ubiquinone/menaquinone biosynthesis C-methylase UbiE